MSALTENIGKWSVYISAFFSSFAILLIIGLLLRLTIPSLPFLQFFGTQWDPSSQTYGILPAIYGTLIVTLISLLIAVPLGIGSAIFISEILPGKYRLYIKSLLEILAGIPSIIYGLIGISILSVWIADIAALSHGRTLLTGAILLSIMILPTIMTLCEDAFHHIPQHYKESAYGLGLTKQQSAAKVLFPIALPGIIGAVLLGLGRAMGETMAVMLVVGSIDKLPSPLYNLLSAGQTITSKLGREIAESSFGSPHFSALVGLAAILMIAVLGITFASHAFIQKEERLHE